MTSLDDKTGKIKDSVSYKITDENGEVSYAPTKGSLKCIVPNCNKPATHRCIGQFLYCKKHLDDVRMFFSNGTIEEL